MNILTLVSRNCRRKWQRTLLLLGVFALGVAAIVTLVQVSRVVGESLEEKLTAFGANVLVTPKKEQLTVSYGGFTVGEMVYDVKSLDADRTIHGIRNIELSANVSAVAPKLVARTTAKGMGVGVIGVDWEQERRIKSYWAVAGGWPERPGDVVLGSSAADRLEVVSGDFLPTALGEFQVAGVLHPTGSDDDEVIFMDMVALQKLTGRHGEASFVEVAALCAGCPIEDIVNQIAAALPGAEVDALRSVIQQRMFSVRFVQKLVLTVSLVILLTACAMVGLSMLSSVNERKSEIGILRAVGHSKSAVFAVFTLEATAIGLAAGVLGYVAGYAASFKVLTMLDIAGTAAISFKPAWLGLSALGVALVSAVSSAWPAAKAARLDPSSALVTI